jgi:16S rRNA (guanine527-N7)-methyltransferase
MEKLTDRTIASCLEVYGAAPTAIQCEQIRSYIALLLKWNRSISLTTVIEEPEILRFHIGESIFALQAVPEIKNGRLADVGAGAGFPGLPIRMFAPDLEVLLIESNAKKCAFLSEVVREIDLRNVHVLRRRFEEIDEFDQAIDTIVARALGDYEGLLRWSRGSLTPSGKIALWLGESDARDISQRCWFDWGNPIPIPRSRERVILSGRPDT